MRILFTILSLCLAVSTTAKTKIFNTTTTAPYHYNTKSFIFLEQGVEFSVFPDGQFDFYIPSINNYSNVSVNTPNFNFSFNTGYNYNPYVQYDHFGAVIQVQSIPLFYDFYGRISRIGNVVINYNGFGMVSHIGNMAIFYTNNLVTHYTGYVNTYNRYYVVKPWHNYYRVPKPNYCVIHYEPYRRNYVANRRAYIKPYQYNKRPAVNRDVRYIKNNTTNKTYRQSNASRDYANATKRDYTNTRSKSTKNNTNNRYSSTDYSSRKNNERNKNTSNRNFNTNRAQNKKPNANSSRTYNKREHLSSQNTSTSSSRESASSSSRGRR